MVIGSKDHQKGVKKSHFENTKSHILLAYLKKYKKCHKIAKLYQKAELKGLFE